MEIIKYGVGDDPTVLFDDFNEACDLARKSESQVTQFEFEYVDSILVADYREVHDGG